MKSNNSFSSDFLALKRASFKRGSFFVPTKSSNKNMLKEMVKK